MDYKKIIRSRKVRIKIMQALSFIPDELMVKIQYRIKTGRNLDLKNPQRFTEKLQWYKLNHRDPLMAQCVDKYEVRNYIKNCGHDEILNECYGVFDSPDEIDFSLLPNAFVLKDTLGGGGNSVIVINDKTEIDEENIRRQMQEWVDEPTNKKHPGREWVYDGRKHRIIVEKYINSEPEDGGLIDYKFFCFNGKSEYLYVIADRNFGEKSGLAIYDSEYRKLDAVRVDEKPLERVVEKPTNYKEMKTLAETIAKPFPEARVDFYDVDGKILFGEITFFDGSGYMKYDPDEFDYEMGAKFDLDKRTK